MADGDCRRLGIKPGKASAPGREQGFTLLELALVLTVIGMLMGFAITAWRSMQSSQEITAARTRLKTLSLCLENYVLHSERIPPQSYFTAHCIAEDPWGEYIIYQTSGDDQEVAYVGTKIMQDDNGAHPDAVWILVSTGPDRIRQMVTTAMAWNCAGGDDLCLFTTRNGLVRQIER